MVCYICGLVGANTRDHVIPQCFFTPPPPPNLLTLRAHHACHHRLDEEYTRNLLASLGRNSSVSAAHLWGNAGAVWRSYARNAPLRRATVAGMVPRTEVFSPGGIYLGDAPAIRFDRTRVYPTLEKIVRGLHCHHTGRLLPRGASFAWSLNEILYGVREQLFEYATPGLHYSDVFESRYVVEEQNGLEFTAWWLRFYQWTVFRCLVAPHAIGQAAGRGGVSETGGA